MKKISSYIDEAIDSGVATNSADLARKLGVSRSALSEWRAERSSPNDDQAVKLADLLGKDAGEILAECGAARAKSPETRRAWERIAARMAASSITVCAMVIAIRQSQEASASQALPYQQSAPSNFQNRAVRRFVLGLLRIFQQFRHLNAQGRGHADHSIGRHPAALGNVAV